MTITAAYDALTTALRLALTRHGFLEHTHSLAVDPGEDILPDGLDGSPKKAAALFNRGTEVARTMLGGVPTRYVVERRCELEMVAVADPEALPDIMAQGLAAAASIVAGNADHMLGGKCERILFAGAAPGDPEPGLASLTVAYILRVRSGDPLGITD